MAPTVQTEPEQTKRPVPPGFKPFVKGDPRINRKGAPAGRIRNVIQTDFLRALSNDFKEHGEAVIETVRTTDPGKYLSIVAQLVPKELTVKHDPLGELSDGELLDALDSLRRFLAAREIGGGSTEEGTQDEGA